MNKRQFNNSKRLTNWLNSESVDKTTKERIASIVRDILTLASTKAMRFLSPELEAADLSKFPPLNEDWVGDQMSLDQAMSELKIGWKEVATHRNIDRAIANRLDLAISHYKFRPCINLARSASPTMTGKLFVQMIPDEWEPPAPKWKQIRAGSWPSLEAIYDAPPKIQEAYMVLHLIGIAQAGTIERIRQCRCSNWFFASRTDKFFCDENCRKKFHVPTEEQKKKRREWNRKYHREHQRDIRKKLQRELGKSGELPKVSTKRGNK